MTWVVGDTQIFVYVHQITRHYILEGSLKTFLIILYNFCYRNVFRSDK